MVAKFYGSFRGENHARPLTYYLIAVFLLMNRKKERSNVNGPAEGQKRQRKIKQIEAETK